MRVNRASFCQPHLPHHYFNCLLMLIISATIGIPPICINLNKMHPGKPGQGWRKSSCFTDPSELGDGFFFLGYRRF